MDIYLYNSLTNKIEKFIPIKENELKIYVCGPTVYNDPHIGNMRPIVTFDLILRGYKHLYLSTLFTNCLLYYIFLMLVYYPLRMMFFIHYPYINSRYPRVYPLLCLGLSI